MNKKIPSAGEVEITIEETLSMESPLGYWMLRALKEKGAPVDGIVDVHLDMDYDWRIEENKISKSTIFRWQKR